MSKISKYFPSYKLGASRPNSTKCPGARFEYRGTAFTTDFPMFGVTETQKAVMRWAWNKTPPVISVSHERPVTYVGEERFWPNDLHQTYFPYAMAIATLECLGELEPRRVKVYFCNVVYHVEQGETKIHTEHKGVHVVPV